MTNDKVDVTTSRGRAKRIFVGRLAFQARIRDGHTIARGIPVDSQMVGTPHGAYSMRPVPQHRVFGVFDLVLVHFELPRRTLALDLWLGVPTVPPVVFLSIPQLDARMWWRRGRWS